MTLELSVAQLNFTVGDMAGNAQKIMDAARRSYANGARLLITPELSICGYAAEDLFLRASFISACEQAVDTIRHPTTPLTHPPDCSSPSSINFAEHSKERILDRPAYQRASPPPFWNHRRGEDSC